MSIMNFKKSKKSPAPGNVPPAVSVGAHSPTNFNLIRKPWLSEKAGNLSANNQYVFLVQKYANKKEVAKEISRRYGVKVEAVNIIRQPGKTKKVGNVFGRASGFKKAIVTIKKGEKLEIT
jgi:large subunit ribosomal protein L23